ncbi:glass bottom boat [Carabus blaptoides fortunei]
MTTAARPTFEPARGGQGRGEKDLSAISRQYSSRDLPGHTKLKFREHGQGTIDENRSRDFRKELEEREVKGRSGRQAEHSSSSSSKRLKLDQVPAASLDADDPLDEEESDTSDSEDETEALLAELNKIKRERAAEQSKKEIEKKQEEEHQTMIERIMTKEEQREVEYEILNMLGLPNRPRKKINAPLKKSAPRFLMDVYKTLMDDSNRHTRSTELNLSGEEQQAIDESDIIMTFETQSDRVSSVRHERGKRLWFNVNEVPVSENIVGAELRIYKNSNLTTFDPNDQFIVTAYQLIRTDDGERELEFVTSLNITADYMGWIELNMTGPLSSWVAFPHSNKGLYLSVHPVDRPGHEIRPEDIGLVSAKGDDEKQPFMVAFLKAVNHVKVRARRDTRKKPEYSPANTIRSTYPETNYGSSRSCKIKNLYINFKDLKWQDWIIAPEGYAAFFCSDAGASDETE